MAQLLSGEPFVEVLRGPLVESVHAVAAYAIDANGRELLSIGSVNVPTYLRSAAKPFIAATALMAGVAQQFGLEQREIAVMAASHSGEPFHIDAVRSILKKIGLDESALQCGADYPYDEHAREALQSQGIRPARIYHNCSGKHAGILSLCRAIGADPATYMERENAAQQRILAFCAGMSDDYFNGANLAVDGCGIPVYATTLKNAARSYLRLATLTGITPEAADALRTVREAMIAYPEYMSGTGDFDAALIRAYDGTLVCKGGAEGVLGVALIEPGAALVIKVIDGNERARPPGSIHALRRIGLMNDERYEKMRAYANPPVKNRAGRVVGEIRAFDRVIV
jgi:L-asparaginase II